jgi:hypothetical protein
VILLVVLALLSLFAVVGLSFVFYSDSEAHSSRVFREASGAPPRADVDPEMALSLFLSQFIYDVDDAQGIYSALRGYSLMRSTYGLNYAINANGTITCSPNNTPFSGAGRMDFSYPFAANVPAWLQGQSDSQMINYTYFPQDGILRDPERYNGESLQFVGGVVQYVQGPPRSGPPQIPVIAGIQDNRGRFVGGFNVPYTYPDINNLYLGAVQADGTLLMPSFHRPWIFGPLTQTTMAPPLTNTLNTNWVSTIGKYKILRPRPIDQILQSQVNAYNGTVPAALQLPWPIVWENLTVAQSRGLVNTLIPNLQQPGNLPYQKFGQIFPYPEDDRGDVKNLVGAPGGNDSLWLDLNAPIMTLPDGRKYKMLFAPLIVDLDNRINLNLVGNVRGGQNAANPTHVSNQGWGPWEINPRLISTTNQQELANLLARNNNPRRVGRYGYDSLPSQSGTVATPGRSPHFYAPVDFDGVQDNTYAASQQWSLPTGTSCFPNFPNTSYGNGNVFERTNHPLNYNYFQPGGDDHRFSVSSLARLLRFNDTGAEFLNSELLTLCPLTFSNPADPAGSARRRNLVTTISFDFDRPGLTPLYYNPSSAPTQNQLTITAGSNPTIFPSGPSFNFPSPLSALNPVFPAAPSTPSNGEFSGDWRSQNTLSSVARILERLDLNRSLPDYPAPSANGRIIDIVGFDVAQTARQQFAKDIFDTLRMVTGAPSLTNPAPTSGSSQYDTLRWLAQLSANIVDYIDSDDYSTPFYWPAAAGDPNGWVFGTELPRLVINEAYVGYTGAGTRTYQTWVELYNPFSTDTTLSDSGAAKLDMPAAGGITGGPIYPIYQLQITQPEAGAVPNMQQPGNVRGDPINVLNTFTVWGTSGNAVLNLVQPSGGQKGQFPVQWGGTLRLPANQGYYLVGPNGGPPPGATNFPNQGNNAFGIGPQNKTLHVTNNAIAQFTAADVGGLPISPMIVLRRLACPHLPPQNNPALARYNPYITVDYMDNITANLNGTGSSRGRYQPYGAVSNELVAQTTPQGALPQGTVPQTFFQSNNPTRTGAIGYDWLVHLDRQLISPMELLHVSAFKPHLLTHAFITYSGATRNPFTQNAPWFDERGVTAGQTARLARFFEFVETRSRASSMGPVSTSSPLQIDIGNNRVVRPTAMRGYTTSGVPWSIQPKMVLVVDPFGANPENVRVIATTATTFTANFLRTHAPNTPIYIASTGDRVPGKININTVWDVETFRAICDAQGANNFTSPQVDNIFNNFIYTATITTSNSQVTQLPALPRQATITPASMAGIGVGTLLLVDPGTANQETVTVLAVNPPANPTTFTALFTNPHDTGFVIQLSAPSAARTKAPQGRGPTQNDKPFLPLGTELVTFATTSNIAVTAPFGLPKTIVPAAMSGVDNFGNPWAIQVGSRLLVDTAPNQELVTVTQLLPAAGPPYTSFQATGFTKAHAAGFLIQIPNGQVQLPDDGTNLQPRSYGLNNTLLRSQSGGSGSTPRLFEVSGSHPYSKYELMTKIFNNLTTRSNVFAVYLTVGFFEVRDVDPGTGQPIFPPKLGAEIGRAQNKHVRHRMMAIVDRTALNFYATNAATPVPPPPTPAGQLATVTPAAMSGVDTFGNPWSIQVGDVLQVDTNLNFDVTTSNPTAVEVPPSPPGPPFPRLATITPAAMSGSDNFGNEGTRQLRWAIRPGDFLKVDTGSINEETVQVLAVAPPAAPTTFTALFTKPHPAGFVITSGGGTFQGFQGGIPVYSCSTRQEMVTVTATTATTFTAFFTRAHLNGFPIQSVSLRPQPQFDPHANPGLVRYQAVID